MELEATVSELAPRLLRYTRGLLPSPSLAEETAQEALTALVERWRRHGPPNSPEAFAFTVARRRAARAAKSRRSWLSLVTADGSVDEPEAVTPCPESSTLARSEWAQVTDALGQLSGKDREALLLAAAGELSTADAARVLRVSRSAFKMRLHRARHRLAALLDTDSPEVSGTSSPEVSGTPVAPVSR
jgi:RNA polymerase sigma-70 factor (ECF subfamily)